MKTKNPFLFALAVRRGFMYNIVMEISEKTNDGCILDSVRAAFGPLDTELKDPTQLGPLVLAYIGDTVYDLYVRTKLVTSTGLTAHGLHLAAAKRVCAKAQAEAYRRAEDILTEEETAIFRRGRNSHIGTVPKNASIADYRSATGLEAVIGWLYLSGKDERLAEIMTILLDEQKD